MFTLQMSMELLAAMCCAVFAGASVYINWVEHPARMSLGTETALAEWAPSYKRATRMQAPLAVLGSACAMVAWFAGSGMEWLGGSLLLAMVVPWTLLVIRPVNQLLLTPDLDRRSEETGQLLDRWNRLHAARSVFSLAALLLFLVGS